MKIPQVVYESLKSPITFSFIAKAVLVRGGYGGMEDWKERGVGKGTQNPGIEADNGKDERSAGPSPLELNGAWSAGYPIHWLAPCC